jgi:hypothetical protein
MQAIWHNKKVLFLNEGFNECNKAFCFLKDEKSNETGVLTSSG